LLVPDIANRASFALDESGIFAFTSGYGITLKPAARISPKFLLGLLNSKLLDVFWKQISTPLRGGFYRYFTQFLSQLPISTLNLSDATERKQHDSIVKLVDRILTAKAADAATDTSALESEIDRMVYELYGLMEEEIAIVEDTSK
jgi:hypothetical protein